MGLLDDISSGQYNLELFVILFVLAFHQYWRASSIDRCPRQNWCTTQNKQLELMAETDITPQLKEAIKKVYMADVESIRNLSEVATKLQKEGLTIPGNLTVTGTINVKGASTLDSTLIVKGASTLDGTCTMKSTFNYLPAGTVVSWTGATAPAGWALCDGQNSTPNLQGRFILGLNPAGGKDGKVPGDDYSKLKGMGGDQINKLTAGEMPAHAHDMDVAGNHAHHYTWGNGGWPARGWFASLVTDRTEWTATTAAAGDHKHAIKNSGGNEAHNNMPPYYILAYIMKL